MYWSFDWQVHHMTYLTGLTQFVQTFTDFPYRPNSSNIVSIRSKRHTSSRLPLNFSPSPI